MLWRFLIPEKLDEKCEIFCRSEQGWTPTGANSQVTLVMLMRIFQQNPSSAAGLAVLSFAKLTWATFTNTNINDLPIHHVICMYHTIQYKHDTNTFSAIGYEAALNWESFASPKKTPTVPRIRFHLNWQQCAEAWWWDCCQQDIHLLRKFSPPHSLQKPSHPRS